MLLADFIAIESAKAVRFIEALRSHGLSEEVFTVEDLEDMLDNFESVRSVKRLGFWVELRLKFEGIVGVVQGALRDVFVWKAPRLTAETFVRLEMETLEEMGKMLDGSGDKDIDEAYWWDLRGRVMEARGIRRM